MAVRTSSGTRKTMLKPGLEIEHPKGFRFLVTRVLATGPFSDVYQVDEQTTNESFAMKVEREEGNIRPVLKLDVYVLTQLGSQVGFPQMVAAGRTENYKYAVMQLIGPDLGKLRRAMPAKKFSLGTALIICKQTLRRIETLHDLGWLCRDIKAPNFAVGLGDKINTIYMLDFGFARRYMDRENNLLPQRSAAALLGTIQYASLTSHFYQEQCRRDDLESWLYMCVELISGPLPWSKLNPIKNHKMICDWKQFIRLHGREEFFQNCPDEFSTMLSRIDAISFEERPPYDELHEIVDKMMYRLCISEDDPLDWQRNDEHVLKRSRFVGELGQSHLMSVRMRENINEDLLNTAEISSPSIDIDVEI